MSRTLDTGRKNMAVYVAGDEIAGKSNIPITLSQSTSYTGYVIDSDYVHTNNHYMDGENSILA
jgi:hypothetical protein